MACNPNFDKDVRKHRLTAIRDALESYGELISHSLNGFVEEGRLRMTDSTYLITTPGDYAVDFLVAADKQAKQAYEHVSIALEVEGNENV